MKPRLKENYNWSVGTKRDCQVCWPYFKTGRHGNANDVILRCSCWGTCNSTDISMTSHPPIKIFHAARKRISESTDSTGPVITSRQTKSTQPENISPKSFKSFHIPETSLQNTVDRRAVMTLSVVFFRTSYFDIQISNNPHAAYFKS